MNFWKDGLSIEESKFSILVCLLIVGFFFALYIYLTTGDFSDNLLELLKIIIIAITGINIANGFTQVANKIREFTNKNDKEMPF